MANSESLPRRSPAFDYTQLDPALAGDARSLVKDIRARPRDRILDTGQDLLTIRPRFPHGSFLRWVRSELGLTARTAQNYMRAAAKLGHVSETVSHLPPTARYALSSSAVSDETRNGIVARLRAGERIGPTEIVRLCRRSAASHGASDVVPDSSRVENPCATAARETQADEERPSPEILNALRMLSNPTASTEVKAAANALLQREMGCPGRVGFIARHMFWLPKSGRPQHIVELGRDDGDTAPGADAMVAQHEAELAACEAIAALLGTKLSREDAHWAGRLLRGAGWGASERIAHSLTVR